jgi:hypothetical protein
MLSHWLFNIPSLPDLARQGGCIPSGLYRSGPLLILKVWRETAATIVEVYFQSVSLQRVLIRAASEREVEIAVSWKRKIVLFCADVEPVKAGA